MSTRLMSFNNSCNLNEGFISAEPLRAFRETVALSRYGG